MGGARITVTAMTVKRRRVLRELHVERREEEEEGKRQGSQTVGRIREENKIRNPQRLEQRETGGD